MAVTLMVLIVAITAGWAGLRAAPYLPTRQKDVDRMLALADIKPGDVVYDLGAGDGRFLISAAKKGAQATGFEISILPFLVAKLRIAMAGVGDKAKMKAKDFFHVNLSQANVIVCFLTPAAMAKLKPKFQAELKPGTRIVSYAFALPDWPPTVKEKPDPKWMAVYLYRV